ncbi:hypothetical protein GCM10027521_39300 [Amycolatopsis cihanbeyliensis]
MPGDELPSCRELAAGRLRGLLGLLRVSHEASLRGTDPGMWNIVAPAIVVTGGHDGSR